MLGFANALDTMLALQRAFDDAKNNDYFGLGTPNRGTYPHVNIFKDGDNSVLTAELAGVEKEDIKIEVKGNLVRLYGERKIQFPKDASVHRVERRNFKFDRTVKLGHRVDMDKIQADYKNGVLKIVMPIAESEKPKEITIS